MKIGLALVFRFRSYFRGNTVFCCRIRLLQGISLLLLLSRLSFILFASHSPPQKVHHSQIHLEPRGIEGSQTCFPADRGLSFGKGSDPCCTNTSDHEAEDLGIWHHNLKGNDLKTEEWNDQSSERLCTLTKSDP